MIFDNPYFVAPAAEAAKRLGEFAIKCLDSCVADLRDGHEIKKKEFKEEYCLHFKVVELYKRRQIRLFGAVASENPTFHNLVESLLKPGMRVRVVACAKANLRLEGASDENPGIIECRQLFLEFQRTKAGSSAATGNTPAIVMPPAPAVSNLATEADGKDGQIDCSTNTDDAVTSSLVLASAPPRVDSVTKKAANEAQELLDSIMFFFDMESLEKAFKSLVQPSWRVVFVNQAPTSRSKVTLTYLETSKNLVDASSISKFEILSDASSRLDLLAQIEAKSAQLFPKLPRYIMPLSGGDTQTQTSKFAFLYRVVSDPAVKGSPSVVPLLKHRAKQYEGTMLRCLNKNCSLRPGGCAEKNEPTSAKEEIPPEDLEVDFLQSMLDEEEAAGNEGADLDDEIDSELMNLDRPNSGAGKRDYIVDLWAWSNSLGYSRKFLEEVIEGHQSNLVVHLTTSAHPSLWVAARLKGLKVMVLQVNPSKHCHAHGRQLAFELFFRSRYPDCLKSVVLGAGSTKRAWVDACQFISPRVLESSLLEIFDISPLESDSFAGFDYIPSQLSHIVANTRQEELAKFSVRIENASDRGRGLFSGRCFKDGDVICDASCLLYSSFEKLQDALTNPDVSQYVDSIVKIPNMRQQGRDITLYAIMVGVARFANDYTGAKKAPNAVLIVNPWKGPNTGFLQIVCETKRGMGITDSQEVLLNYGADFDISHKFNAANDSKRFKEMLEGMSSPPQPVVVGPANPAVPNVSAINVFGPGSSNPALTSATVQPDSLQTPTKQGAQGLPDAPTPPTTQPQVTVVAAGAPENDELVALKARGAIELAKLEQPKATLVFLPTPESPSTGTFHFVSHEDANKHIKKEQALLKWLDGTLEQIASAPEGRFLYELTLKSPVWNLSSHTKETLQEMLKKNPGTSSVYGYEAFTPGSPPKEFKTVFPHKLYFQPPASSQVPFAAIFQVLANMRSLTALWAMEYNGDHKALRPAGVVLHLDKQILCKSKSSIQVS